MKVVMRANLKYGSDAYLRVGHAYDPEDVTLPAMAVQVLKKLIESDSPLIAPEGAPMEGSAYIPSGVDAPKGGVTPPPTHNRLTDDAPEKAKEEDLEAVPPKKKLQ